MHIDVVALRWWGVCSDPARYRRRSEPWRPQQRRLRSMGRSHSETAVRLYALSIPTATMSGTRSSHSPRHSRPRAERDHRRRPARGSHHTVSGRRPRRRRAPESWPGERGDLPPRSCALSCRMAPGSTPPASGSQHRRRRHRSTSITIIGPSKPRRHPIAAVAPVPSWVRPSAGPLTPRGLYSAAEARRLLLQNG